MPNPESNPIPSILTGTDPVVDWLVKEFIARGTLTIWAGEPAAGKSYACYTISIACATGTSFLGYEPVRPLRILYFDQENSRADRDQYLRWAWNGLNRPALERIAENFWVCHFVLGLRDWHQTVKKIVADVKPDLMFFDTATPCFGIEDENDNGSATQVVNHLRAIINLLAPAPAIIVLKHARIVQDSMDGRYKQTIRGAKAWAGASDAMWFHLRTVGRPRQDGLSNTTITPQKVRAFGLRQDIHIRPSWVGQKSTSTHGLALHRADGPEIKTEREKIVHKAEDYFS